MNKIVLSCFLGLACFDVTANTSKRIPFEECFSGAAHRFSVNKIVLVAIAKTESKFDPRAIGRVNADGSFDLGMMQINSSWFPKLLKSGITNHDLLNGCTNIYVGAWILSHNIKSYGNTWKAVGAYNARSPLKQVVYVNKVMTATHDIKQNYHFR